MLVDKNIVDMYSRPLMGGSLPYFIGGNQQGGNWLQRFRNFALPILKKLGLSAAKSVGKAAVNTATDVLDNKQSFKESIKNRAMESLSDVKKSALDAIKEGIASINKQKGSGIRNRRKRKRNNTSFGINKRQKYEGTIFAA